MTSPQNVLEVEKTIRQEQEMTGYTVHSGTTIKFSEGWDRVFQESAAKTKKSAKKANSSGAAKAKAKIRVKRAAKKKH